MITSTAPRLAPTFNRRLYMEAKSGMPNGIPFQRHGGQIQLCVTLRQRFLATVFGKWGAKPIFLHATQPGIERKTLPLGFIGD
ncbi:hypothetical protein D3C84_1040540 [compost metagenome]